MLRIRIDNEGTEFEEEIRFEPLQYGGGEDPHYRIEIKVRTIDEVRDYHNRGDLIGLRMAGQPAERAPQRSIISPHQIHGLGLPAE